MRKLISTIILIVTAVLLIPTATADFDASAHKNIGSIGQVTFYRPDKDERATFVWRDSNGKIDQAALEKINYFFRCRLTGETYPIDPGLIELLDEIENHFGAKEIKLISTYRSPERNAMMRRMKRGVASGSLHMKGMAADIEIAGVSPSKIWNFAHSLSRGGVGYYGSRSFVHVDTGRVRTWGARPQVKIAAVE